MNGNRSVRYVREGERKGQVTCGMSFLSRSSCDGSVDLEKTRRDLWTSPDFFGDWKRSKATKAHVDMIFPHMCLPTVVQTVGRGQMIVTTT